MVDHRYVFNRFSVENVRLGVAEVTGNFANNCKSIFIFGTTAVRWGNVSIAESGLICLFIH